MTSNVGVWSTWQEIGDRHTFRQSSEGVELEIEVRPFMEYPCFLKLRNTGSETAVVHLDLGPSVESTFGLGRFRVESAGARELVLAGEFQPAARLQIEPGSVLEIFLTDLPGIAIKSPTAGDRIEFGVDIETESGCVKLPVSFRIESTHEVRIDHLLIGH